MLYCETTGGVSGGDEVEPREREETSRRAGVVGGVGVGDRPVDGGGVGAGGGTPGTECGVGEQRRDNLRMVGVGGVPGWRGRLHMPRLGCLIQHSLTNMHEPRVSEVTWALHSLATRRQAAELHLHHIRVLAEDPDDDAHGPGQEKMSSEGSQPYK